MNKIILEEDNEIELTEREQKIYEQGCDDGANEVLDSVIKVLLICIGVVIVSWALFSLLKNHSTQ